MGQKTQSCFIRDSSASWLRPVCRGFHNLIRINCAPSFASCRRQRVLTVTCLDTCRSVTEATEWYDRTHPESQLRKNEKDSGRGIDWGVLWVSACRDWVRPRKSSLRVAGFRTDISRRDLPTTRPLRVLLCVYIYIYIYIYIYTPNYTFNWFCWKDNEN
jgi:hypothetical protein